MDNTQSSVGEKLGEAREQLGGTATEQFREVADTARQQAGHLASVSTDELHQAMQRVTEDLREQAASQTERVADKVRTLGHQLRAVSEGRCEEGGPVTDLMGQAAGRAELLVRRLDEGGMEGVARDVSRFARRRPVMFLLGAVAAGVIVGRFARAQRDAPHSPNGDRGRYDAMVRTETGAALDPAVALASPAGVGASTTGVVATAGQPSDGGGSR